MFVNPSDFFSGTILATVPHMDDCVLGFGGAISLLPDKSRVHIVYATDGRRSPEPLFPWRDEVDVDLAEIRSEEARQAMSSLGVPRENLRFLGLPDSRLARHTRQLRRALESIVADVQPTQILVPFRFDRHPDHLALNRTVTTIHREAARRTTLTEYFVYYRWRLLGTQDVRSYIQPDQLVKVDLSSVSGKKRAALDCFRSQVTRYFPWQTRPNLTAALLDAVSREPEYFLRYDHEIRGAGVFERSALWIRLVHRIEPFLKKRKDRIVALVKRGATPPNDSGGSR